MPIKKKVAMVERLTYEKKPDSVVDIIIKNPGARTATLSELLKGNQARELNLLFEVFFNKYGITNFQRKLNDEKTYLPFLADVSYYVWPLDSPLRSI